MVEKNNKQKGVLGERIALKALIQKSHNIIKRNYYSKFGEIDIISVDNDTLVFSEVKARSANIEAALSSVSSSKQSKIIKTAYHFLSQNPQFEDFPTRFDIIVIIMRKNGKTATHHFEDAYLPDFS